VQTLSALAQHSAEGVLEFVLDRTVGFAQLPLDGLAHDEVLAVERPKNQSNTHFPDRPAAMTR
jgi:hypothetical protein